MNDANRTNASARPTIADLRTVRDMLLGALPFEVDIPAAARVAGALDAILRSKDAAFALGMKVSAGQRLPLNVERRAARDDLLRRMADRHYAGQSISAQANAIDAAAKAYWRKAAKVDVELEGMPESYAGMPREFLFQIARLPETVPQPGTVRKLLANR